MHLLPHWVLTDKNPAFYDSESATAIEQTAKVYAAMQELITEYNKFADCVNSHIEEFINDTNADYEEFRTGVHQEFQDFIDTVELKMKSQDANIEDAINYMKTNLNSAITELVEHMRESGELSNDILAAFEELENSIMNFRLDIDALKNAINRKFIFISDSYGNRVNDAGKNFFDLIAENLGLAEGSYFHNNIGGAAFAHATAGYKFLELLQAIAGQIETPESITDVIVIGGANDVGYQYDATLQAIGAFKNYVAATYKNARITLAHVGLTFTNTEMEKRLYNSLKAWRDSIKYGIGFMNNSEYVLCNSTLLTNDMCHPNAAGVDEIAKQITQGILSGSCDVRYMLLGTDIEVTGNIPGADESLIYTTKWNGNMMRVNNTVELYGSGGVSCGSFVHNVAQSIAKGAEIKLTFSDSLFCGFNQGKKTTLGYLMDKDTKKLYPVGCTFANGAASDGKICTLRIFLIAPTDATGYQYELLLNLVHNID